MIATKGGLTRQGPGRWGRNCRPEYLRSACEASLHRLRVDRIDLYQLHTVDPAVPLEESLGALVELQGEGKIRHIGVCNIGVAELDARSRSRPSRPCRIGTAWPTAPPSPFSSSARAAASRSFPGPRSRKERSRSREAVCGARRSGAGRRRAKSPSRGSCTTPPPRCPFRALHPRTTWRRTSARSTSSSPATRSTSSPASSSSATQPRAWLGRPASARAGGSTRFAGGMDDHHASSWRRGLRHPRRSHDRGGRGAQASLARASGTRVTSDPDYYLTLLDAEPNILRPHVILLEKDGAPAGMAVGRVEERTLSCRIGYRQVYAPRVRSLTVSYGGFLGSAAADDSGVVVGQLRHALGRREAEIVYAPHVDLASPVHAVAGQGARFSAGSMRRDPSSTGDSISRRRTTTSWPRRADAREAASGGTATACSTRTATPSRLGSSRARTRSTGSSRTPSPSRRRRTSTASGSPSPTNPLQRKTPSGYRWSAGGSAAMSSTWRVRRGPSGSGRPKRDTSRPARRGTTPRTPTTTSAHSCSSE